MLHIYLHIPSYCSFNSCSKSYKDVIAKNKFQTLIVVSRLLFIYQHLIMCGWFHVKVSNTNRSDIREYCQTSELECITYWKKSERKR